MSDDYFDTARIMKRDSLCLHSHQYWHTACYLAGYVVECGLKAIREKDGMTQTQLRKSPYGHSLPNLAGLITSLKLFTNYRGTSFDIAKITNSQLYRDWTPEKRYQPKLWDHQTISDEFQDAAQYMCEFLNELRLNGAI